ncbi:MAG TPA: aldo/keto reductase [Gaiellaceae bacterium]
MIERVPFGRTRLTVTRVGLGTAPLGGLYSGVVEDTALDTVRRAYDRGLRFFDTAPLYGHGVAEQRTGRALAELSRDGYVLATKVGRLLRADAPPDDSQLSGGFDRWPVAPPVNPVFDFSYDGVLRSVEESLERLGLDRVDILHIHDPDEHEEEALAGAYPALDRLREEGVIAAVGAGMNQAAMLARFARAADFDCFLVAGRYTLLDQAALDELFPLCLERGIAVVLGGVYNSGLLADPRPGAMFDYAPASPELVERAQRLDAVCGRHGVPLKAAALQFASAHPAVTVLLLGARDPAELEENLELLRTPVPAELWDELRRERLVPEEAPTP